MIAPCHSAELGVQGMVKLFVSSNALMITYAFVTLPFACIASLIVVSNGDACTALMKGWAASLIFKY